MSKGLARRVGRIISASINALVETVEDTVPEVVMERAIEEVDAAIDEVRSDLGKIIASQHLANKRLSETHKDHRALAEKIEVALSKRRDDLAAIAISNQLDIEAQIPVLEQTIVACGEDEKQLEGYLIALQAKKREMQNELHNYRERVDMSPGEVVGDHNHGKVNETVDKAVFAFDRVLEKQVGRSSLKMVDAQNAVKMAELEQLTREHRVQERLVAMKSVQEDQ